MLYLFDKGHGNACTEVFGLMTHRICQGEPVGVRQARIVVDLAGQDDLSANCFLLEQYGVEQSALCVYGSSKPGGTTAYYDEVFFGCIHTVFSWAI